MWLAVTQKKNIPVKSVRSEKKSNKIRVDKSCDTVAASVPIGQLFTVPRYRVRLFFFGGGFIVDVVSAEATTWCKYCAVLVALKRNLFDRHNAAILDRSTTIRISDHLPLAMTTSLLSAPKK